jgi:hypothetical protein
VTSADSVLIGRDTQTLVARLRVISMGATTATVRVSFTGPNNPSTGTITITQILGVTVTGFVEGNTFTLIAGSGDGDYTPSTKYLDIVVSRPTVGSQPGRVTVRADLAGYNSDPAQIDIVPQIPNGPARFVIVGTSQGVGSGDYFINWRVYRNDGVEIDYANVSYSWTRTPTTGSPVVTNGTPTRDVVNGWWVTSFTRVTGDQNFVRLQNGADTATTANDFVLPVPTYYVGGSAGTPRIATATIVFVPSSPGAGVASAINLNYTLADAPSGAVVNAVLTPRNITTTFVALTTGDQVATGRPFASSASAPYSTLWTLSGTVTLTDSSGNVLHSKTITTTQYYGN